MAHNVTKVLCHPGVERSPLCVYNEKITAYAMYFSDEANPPKPESLQIVTRRGPRELRGFVWEPVVQVIGNPNQDVEVFGEYDETGKVI